MSEATKAVREELKTLEAKLDRMKGDAAVVERRIQIHKNYLGQLNGAAPKVATAPRATPQKPKRGTGKRKVSVHASPATSEEMWTRRAIIWYLLVHGAEEGCAPGYIHREMTALIPTGQRLPTRAATQQMLYSTPFFIGNGKKGTDARVKRTDASEFNVELRWLSAVRGRNSTWKGPNDLSNCIAELKNHAPAGISI